MHYQLFLPNWPSGASDEVIESQSRVRGISDVWGQHDVLPNIQGPGDQMGVLVAWLSQTTKQHCYKPEKQAWIKSLTRNEDGVPHYWVGIWKESEPTEQELRRHYTQEGVITDLGGTKWILPLPTTVDAQAVYNDDGTMRWEPIRKFSWMCDEAKLVTDKLTQNGEFGRQSLVYSEDPSKQVDWLLKLLRVNYRMLPELAVHMGLWMRKQHILDTYLKTLGLVVKEPVSGN